MTSLRPILSRSSKILNSTQSWRATVRSFSAAPDPNSDRRHSGILMHPDSISGQILPGGTTVMRSSTNGGMKERYVELAYGYFWMLKDMRQTEDKPIQTSVIAEEDAKLLPNLWGLSSLSGETTMDLPDYALRRNRSRDENAQTTLVVVSFRDYGYQLLSSWTEPYEKQLIDGRHEVIRLTISEGWVNRWMKPLLLGLMRRNTPAADWDSTWTFFGKDDELLSFRDALRMHNSMTAYAFLLDGMGRVRLAGSGPASPEEGQQAVKLAMELTKMKQSRLN